MSKLTKLAAKLESAWKQAQFARQLVEGDLQLAVEVSFWYLSLPFKSFVGCFLACLFFVGYKEDVIPQVLLPPGGIRLDG